jgi:large subunit ribosomal protein L21
MEYAVFATGGKQYRVKTDDKIRIEKLSEEHKEGDSIIFDNVLMTDNGAGEATLGAPFIKGGAVTGTLTKIGRYKTIDVIKYKQKSRYFKKYGHRQPYFEVKIDSIK